MSQLHSLIALRAIHELGLAAAEIARNLSVNTSSITRAIARMGTRKR